MNIYTKDITNISSINNNNYDNNNLNVLIFFSIMGIIYFIVRVKCYNNDS